MDRRTRREVLAASGATLAGVLAGCSTGGSSSADATDSGLPMETEVVMTSTPRIRYEPRLAHVAVGGTVVWRLDSGSHDSTAYHPDTKPPRNGQPAPQRIPDGAEPWASGSLSHVGETFEHTFETPGVYDYLDTEVVCTSHAMIGNVGRVVVGWPDPEGQPALEPPQERLPSLVADRIRELNPRTRELLANHGSTTDDSDQ